MIFVSIIGSLSWSSSLSSLKQRDRYSNVLIKWWVTWSKTVFSSSDPKSLTSIGISMVAGSHRVCNVILCMKARLLCQRTTRSQIYKKNSQTRMHATSRNTQTQQRQMIWSIFARFLFFAQLQPLQTHKRQWPMRPDWERRQASWSKSKKDTHKHTHVMKRTNTHIHTHTRHQTHKHMITNTHSHMIRNTHAHKYKSSTHIYVYFGCSMRNKP